MIIPTLTAVTSRNIDAVGHKANTLYVRFKGGGLYSYEGVPAELHKEMIGAESIGSFFRSKVSGKFVHKKHDA